MSLTVRELSRWQTVKGTNRQNRKQTLLKTMLSSLRCAARVVIIISYADCSLPLANNYATSHISAGSNTISAWNVIQNHFHVKQYYMYILKYYANSQSVCSQLHCCSLGHNHHACSPYNTGKSQYTPPTSTQLSWVASAVCSGLKPHDMTTIFVPYCTYPYPASTRWSGK